MKYLTTPERASIYRGTCECGTNHAPIKYNECTGNCGGNCGTLKICVTPTGAKLSPTGLGTSS